MGANRLIANRMIVSTHAEPKTIYYRYPLAETWEKYSFDWLVVGEVLLYAV